MMIGSRGIIKAFTQLAADYEVAVDAELRRFWGWSYNEFVEWLLGLLALRNGNLQEGDAVLDIATGTALIPRTLMRVPGAVPLVVGVDITPAMLATARDVIASPEARIKLACGSGMALPLADEAFSVVICALGTHHMDAATMLREMHRVLTPDGMVAIADAAASSVWRYPVVRAMLRFVALLYFLPSRNIARAWAEAAAVSHVHTVDEWRTLLTEFGFGEIQVTCPVGERAWSPVPFAITARKACRGATEAGHGNSD